MESATAVRCAGCGYENNPYYRYCGMCGNPLRAGEPPLPMVPFQPPAFKIAPPEPEPPPEQFVPPATQPSARAQEPRQLAPLTINGFSILGLGNDPVEETRPAEPARVDVHREEKYEERYEDRPQYNHSSLSISPSNISPSRSAQYLLEDEEEPRSRWRTYVSLALLSLAAGGLLWHWQTNGYPWDEPARQPVAHRNAPPAPDAEEPLADPTSVARSKPSPAGASSEPSSETSPKPETEAAPPAAVPEPESKADVAPSGQAARLGQRPGPTPQAADSAAPDASVLSGPAPAGKRDAPVSPKKSADHAMDPGLQPEAAPAAAATNNPAQLFSQGEKYLYGDGVPQDCDRAQKDLRTSAAHSYPQAESLLGTMYASGHCMGRDLPAAYRWYARALHHEPGNTRIASDLQVLWGEMTAAERKASQSSGQ